MKHPTAAILVIGNEILSGRTQDLNVQYIARHLSPLGIALKHVRIIPDDEAEIILTVKTLSDQYDYIFTTGGIGATHDDITAASIAKAFQVNLVTNDEALEILHDYYKDNINAARKRLALIPEGAELIKNPLSAAPGFKINNVYCMAGIPSVMQCMFDTLVPLLQTGPKIYATTIRCTTLENNIADELGLIQKRFPDLEIGSYPRYNPTGEYSLSLVLRGIDENLVHSATEEIADLLRRQGDKPLVEG